MGMCKLGGVFTVVPAAMLLAVSFFVLFAAAREKKLKGFGYVVCVVLWIAALLVVSMGVCKMRFGKDWKTARIHKMHKMHEMHCGDKCMMKRRMSEMKMPVKK